MRFLKNVNQTSKKNGCHKKTIMKKILYSLLLVSSSLFAQEEKFMIGIHYVGDVSEEKKLPNNFNGLIGLEAKYRFKPLGIASFQAGISFDLLDPRNSNFDNFDYDKTILWNPNIGVELDLFNSGLKPFVNIGYAFYNVSYTSNLIIVEPDPSIQNPVKLEFDYNSITINPGIRYNFKKVLYLEANYKYLPVDKNNNLHFINAGLGARFL
jgi:opacity protein-like surface antigen